MHPARSLPLYLSSLPIWFASAAPTADASQQVIFPNHDDERAPPYLGHGRRRASITEQNSTLCDAGSRHWSGKLPVSGGRDMFFWYFESRESPNTAPLTIWLNGGPGASSLLGAFHEIGPCRVTEDGSATVRAKSTWTSFSNMLFIDQPIGVGFSDPGDQKLWSESLAESAIDLDLFLDAFLEDHFPHLRQAPLHFAGESFGGRFCPVYADIMRRSFDSIILVNAAVNLPQTYLGMYEHFCSPGAAAVGNGFNSSACAEMAAGLSSCENLGRLCDATYDGQVCRMAMETCYNMSGPYQRQVVPGGQNPYDDRKTCIDPPICGDMGMEQVSSFLNLGWVQEALQIEKMKFQTVNMDFNSHWAEKSSAYTPSTREVSSLLDVKKTPILVLNGNNDVVVSTEAILRFYDSLLWSGHAAFRSKDLQNWYYSDELGKKVKGGQMKKEQNLAVVTIDGAGHISPHDQPDAVVQVVERWTRGGAAAVWKMT